MGPEDIFWSCQYVQSFHTVSISPGLRFSGGLPRPPAVELRPRGRQQGVGGEQRAGRRHRQTRLWGDDR